MSGAFVPANANAFAAAYASAHVAANARAFVVAFACAVDIATASANAGAFACANVVAVANANAPEPQMSNRATLPDKVREAFRGRAYLSFDELAVALEFSRNTLRGHLDSGRLPWHNKGIGTQRPRRVFTLGDVEVFWRRISNGASRARRGGVS